MVYELIRISLITKRDFCRHLLKISGTSSSSPQILIAPPKNNRVTILSMELPRKAERKKTAPSDTSTT
jgi:hypothetical protein